MSAGHRTPRTCRPTPPDPTQAHARQAAPTPKPTGPSGRQRRGRLTGRAPSSWTPRPNASRRASYAPLRPRAPCRTRVSAKADTTRDPTWRSGLRGCRVAHANATRPVKESTKNQGANNGHNDYMRGLRQKRMRRTRTTMPQLRKELLHASRGPRPRIQVRRLRRGDVRRMPPPLRGLRRHVLRRPHRLLRGMRKVHVREMRAPLRNLRRHHMRAGRDHMRRMRQAHMLPGQRTMHQMRKTTLRGMHALLPGQRLRNRALVQGLLSRRKRKTHRPMNRHSRLRSRRRRDGGNASPDGAKGLSAPWQSPDRPRPRTPPGAVSAAGRVHAPETDPRPSASGGGHGVLTSRAAGRAARTPSGPAKGALRLRSGPAARHAQAAGRGSGAIVAPPSLFFFSTIRLKPSIITDGPAAPRDTGPQAVRRARGRPAG